MADDQDQRVRGPALEALIRVGAPDLAARLLAQSENPVLEFSIAPLTAFWITLLEITLVGVLILINALATPRQVKAQGLDQAHGASGHEEHH